MTPSLVDMFDALTSAKGWAQGFSQSHPKYLEAVSKFVEDLDQIGLELKTSVFGENEFRCSNNGIKMEATLHDIVNCLLIARVYADLISQREPEYTVPLKRIEAEVQRVWRELLQNIPPGLRSDQD